MNEITPQQILNIALMVISAMGGWMLKSITDNIKALQRSSLEQIERTQRLEIMVAGQYVTHSALENFSQAIFKKLDKIEDKLDKKADKS